MQEPETSGIDIINEMTGWTLTLVTLAVNHALQQLEDQATANSRKFGLDNGDKRGSHLVAG